MLEFDIRDPAFLKKWGLIICKCVAGDKLAFKGLGRLLWRGLGEMSGNVGPHKENKFQNIIYISKNL